MTCIHGFKFCAVCEPHIAAGAGQTIDARPGASVDCAHGIPIDLYCGACAHGIPNSYAEPIPDTNGLGATLAERGSRYGDFTTQAALTQGVLEIWQAAPGWAKLDPVKRAALFYFADKVSRALNGDPNYRDNWHDIAGYAKLVEDRCKP